jgi:acyl-CoA thioester hydrolase
MKSDLWRRDLGAYPRLQTLQVRASDVDPARHVNNVAVMTLHAEACQRFVLTCIPEQPPHRTEERPLRARRLVASFLAETHYPADVQAGLRLLRADAQGALCATALFQHGQCVGTHETTLSAWEHGIPVPLNADEQAHLGAHATPADARSQPVSDIGLPLLATQYPASETITTRFGDHDGRWLLSESAQLRCIEQVRAATCFGLMQQAGMAFDTPGSGLLLLASKRVEFLHLRRVPKQIDARVALKHLGTTSINLAVGLFDGQTCCARADGVAVLVHPLTHRPMAIPEPLRVALQGLSPTAA